MPNTEHEADLVNVYLARDDLEAQFLRNVLAEVGIEANVVGDVAARLVGVMPNAAHVPCLWVRQVDETRAREVLAEYEQKQREPRAPEETGTTWKCAACGESVDEEFELCWNCQNPRSPY
jgi:hypothetical protein